MFNDDDFGKNHRENNVSPQVQINNLPDSAMPVIQVLSKQSKSI